MGENQNPKKSLGLQTKTYNNPMPNFRAIKIYSRNYAAEIRRNYHESSDCFEYPLKIPTYIKLPKKILTIFQTPQKTFDHPCHLKSGVRTHLGKRAYIDVLYSSYLDSAKYFWQSL